MKRLKFTHLFPLIVISMIVGFSSIYLNEKWKVYDKWEVQPSLENEVEGLVAAPDISGWVEVPFARFETKGTVGLVDFNVGLNTSRLRLNNGLQIDFPHPGIPISLTKVDENHFVVIYRDIPTNVLHLVDWDVGNNTINFFPVEREDIEYLLFRAAAFDGENFNLVVYDNRTRKNYLRRYDVVKEEWQSSFSEFELPELEGSAGTTYEMEPPISMFFVEDGVRILGGNLDAVVNSNGVALNRILDCERILEAIEIQDGVAVLCNRKPADALGAYAVFQRVADNMQRSENVKIVPPEDGIPWSLTWDSKDNKLKYRLANSSQQYAAMFKFDLQRAQNSGMLDFGSNNVEGRIPWAQIYYINGFMDAIYMAKRDREAFEVFSPVAKEIRLRLELEMRVIDSILQEQFGMHTRGFTVDRSLAIFAVQSSRFLLLFERYNKEFKDASPFRSFAKLRKKVALLEDHIEILADSGEEDRWLPNGQHHLRWPKGSAFYFDGLAVPFNHQNEWAYSLFESSRNQGKAFDIGELDPQRDIIRHFLRQVAPDGTFPKPERWNYWWGHAFDGYDLDSGLSVNMPEYSGDKLLAYISFRTIDLMSVLSSIDFMPEVDESLLLASATVRVQKGEVYPFSARSLIDRKCQPQLETIVAQKFARSGAPWEFSNQPWALAMLPNRPKASGKKPSVISDYVEVEFY